MYTNTVYVPLFVSIRFFTLFSLSHMQSIQYLFFVPNSYSVNCRRIYIYFTFSLNISKWYIFLVDLFHVKTDSYNSILSRSAAFGVFRVKNVFIWIWRKKIIKKIIWSTEIWNGLSYYLTCLRVIIKRFKTYKKDI